MDVWIARVREYDSAAPNSIRCVTTTATAGRRTIDAQFDKGLRKTLVWTKDRFGTWRLRKRRQLRAVDWARVTKHRVLNSKEKI